MAGPLTPYSTITFAQAKSDLLLRLNSSGADFWLIAEVGLYIIEALRLWNCLSMQYVQDWTTTYTATNGVWQSTGNSQNVFVNSNPTSPRFQTLTDAYIYTLAEYHLLEPPTGAMWTGTPQFNITDLSQALQRRRDQILQATGCNIGPFSSSFGIPANQNRVFLPDTPGFSVLDIRRVRYIPAANQGSPSTLYREDGLAFEYFENDFTTSLGQTPFAYDLISGPPLALTIDTPAPTANTLDILAMISGGLISPPTPSPLLIPDDWYWVLKFGMMADLLRKESESVDLERADYCEQRFQEGIKLMQEMPWLLQARIQNIPVDTPSVAEADEYAYEWQSDPNAQLGIVRGGIDLFALSPQFNGASGGFGTGVPFGSGGFGGSIQTSVSVTLSLIANTPVPVLDTDFLQINRDVYDAILDEAEHLAKFKEGGFEFSESTRTLHKNFIATAVMTNSRLSESGIFTSTLRPVGDSRQDAADPRFATVGASK